jgi:gamma-glutamyltranspeptidase / glutathione hydrolase
MAPTIVFDPAGRLKLVTGSAGGSRIIPYVLKTIIGVIDWELDAQSVVSLPNVSSTGGMLDVEAPPFNWRTALFRAGEAYPAIRLSIGLAPLGQSARFTTLTSGTQTIADPRREGTAAGD